MAVLGGTMTTSHTLGKALTVPRLLTLTSVPLIYVGMRNTVGTPFGPRAQGAGRVRPS